MSDRGLPRREVLRWAGAAGVASVTGASGVAAARPTGSNGDGSGNEGASDEGAIRTETAELVPAPDDTDPGDRFGAAVAVDGDTAIVGAPDDEAPNGNEAGSAHVYRRTEEGWRRETKLAPDDGRPYDAFGTSVALDGDTALVGAPFDFEGSAYVFERSDGEWTRRAKLVVDDEDAVDVAENVAVSGSVALLGAGVSGDDLAGTVYVFELTDGTWSETTKLTLDEETATGLGRSLATTGTTALVGAPYDVDEDGNLEAGAYVFERSNGEWIRRRKLTREGASGSDYDGFGKAVALSEGTAIVGAFLDEVADVNGAGSASVFERSNGEWTRRAKLAPEDGEGGDHFGQSVALSDGTAIVGADGDADPDGLEVGAAYVYGRSGEEWTERAKLAADDGDDGDGFGRPVALSGTTALAGAPGDDDPNGVNGGSVYAFDGDDGGWSQEGKLAPPVSDGSDRAGWSTAVAGDTVLVGAPRDDAPNGLGAGSASVFERSADGWTQRATLAADDGERYDDFGRAVALGDGAALVTAPEADAPGEFEVGAAYVFGRDGGNWTQRAKLVPEDGDEDDYFGVSAAIAGDTALVGASGEEDPNGPDAGAAYVFQRAGGEWTQRAKLVPGDGDGDDRFGTSVALADGTAIVGASADEDPNGSYAGSAYVFERSSDGWSQRAKLTPGDGDADDGFGVSVALADGTAVVGAYGDEDPNGPDAGAAYVFERTGGEWTQRAKLVPGDGDADDLFGWRVATTGTTAAVSAPLDEDPGGSRGGSAYLFERSGGEWTQRAKLAPEDGEAREEFGAGLGLDGATAVVGAWRADTESGTGSGAAYVFDLGGSTAGPVERADRNGDGRISTAELNDAIGAWARGEFTTEELSRIVSAWARTG